MAAGSGGRTAGECCLCSTMSLGVLGWFSERKEKGCWRKMWRTNGGTDLPKRRGLSPRGGKCSLTMSDAAEVNWLLSASVFSEVDQGEL